MTLNGTYFIIYTLILLCKHRFAEYSQKLEICYYSCSPPSSTLIKARMGFEAASLLFLGIGGILPVCLMKIV